MECLIDYIGIDWCGATTTPPSGIYVNSLAGVSFNQLQHLADSEQKTFTGVWDHIQQRAARRMSWAVNAAMNSRMGLFNIKHSYNLKKTLETTAAAVSTKLTSGILVQIAGENDIIESNLASIHIQSLQFYCNSADNATSKVFSVIDTTTGSVLWSKSVTLATGWNNINVEQTFTSDYSDNPLSLYIAFQSNGMTLSSKTVNEQLIGDCSLKICSGTTTVAYNSGVTLDEITQGTNTSGLSAIMSVVCKWDAMVCANRKLFENAWLHCLGVEIANETMMSERENKYTLIRRQDAKDMLDKNNVNSYLSIFESEVKRVCDGIYIDESDACVVCNEVYQVKEAMP
jgi:hypothetical protein